MAHNSFHAARLVFLALAATACGGRENDEGTTATAATAAPASSTGPVAGGSDLWWRNDAYRELDGDEENAERLVATVSKGPLDSTIVRLEIRTSKDRILYRHEWPATSYMKYMEEGSAKDSVRVLREAERQMQRIFSDSAFLKGFEAWGQPEKADVDFDAIRHDLAVHDYRQKHSLKLWEPVPRGAYEEIQSMARAMPLARIRQVANDTRLMPAFQYYAGGEETYVVAWSSSEGRMVRIAACC